MSRVRNSSWHLMSAELGTGSDYSWAPLRPLVLLPLTFSTSSVPSRHENTDSPRPSPASAKPLLGLLSPSRLSVLDLVVALAPHADEAAISKLYSTIRPYLEVSHRGREPGTTTPGASGGSLRCVCVRGMSVCTPCCRPRPSLHLLFCGVAALCTYLVLDSCHVDAMLRPQLLKDASCRPET